MHFESCTMKYVLFGAIILLPGLSRCENECDSFKSLNSTIQGPPVLQFTKTSFEIWYTANFRSLQCCLLSGNPRPTIDWFKNGNRIDLNDYRLKLMDKNQSLWIQNVKRTDAGRYTCQASNTKGNASRDFKVTVKDTRLYQEPVVDLEHNSWSPVLGDNVTLNCIIQKSARKPFVFWLHQKNISDNPRVIRKNARKIKTVMKTEKQDSWAAQFFIRNVTVDDEGVYTCLVRNGLKAANDTGVLAIKEPDEPVDGGIDETRQPEKEQLSGTKERSYVTVVAVLGVLALVIVVASVVVWRRKRRSGTPGYVIDDKDKRLDPTAVNTFLIPNGDSLHYDIPENLQLLKCGADVHDFDFDVFVSYSSQDRDFVKDVLYDELLKTHIVCIDFKDFEAGAYIGSNILDSIFKSRKTLLVVTKNFLKGEWTYFEMQIAQGRIAQGHDALIPVIMDDIPYDELPKPLQLYRQTKTYLEYFNEDVKPHFWDRLRSALGPSLGEVQEKPVATPESPEEEDAMAENFV